MSRIEQISKMQRDIENGAPQPTGGSSISNDLLYVNCPICKKEFLPSKEAHFTRYADMVAYDIHADCWQRVVACRMTLKEAIE